MGDGSAQILFQSCLWKAVVSSYDMRQGCRHVDVIHPTFPLPIPASPTLTDPQWGAADVEIKVPSIENTELKRSPFKAWSRSVSTCDCA